MEMLNSKAELGNIEFRFIFREGHFSGEMEAEISSRAVIKCEIEVMRGLESEMEIDDELVVGLLEDVGLDYCILQLLLKDEVFLL